VDLLQQIAKVLQHTSRTVENHNSGKPQQWKTTIHLPHMNLIIFPASTCPTSLFKQNKSIVVFHFSACMLQDFCNLLYLFEVHMNPTLNRSSAVCRFGYGDVIEVCNGIIFYFYMRLSQLWTNMTQNHQLRFWLISVHLWS